MTSELSAMLAVVLEQAFRRLAAQMTAAKGKDKNTQDIECVAF
jgi:hypothetical protein